MIIKYLIEKCKNNDYDTIKNYQENKLYELFINPEMEQNLLIIALINEEFDVKRNFIGLLPDKLNKEEIGIISHLIYKIIEKINPNEIVEYQADNNEFFYYIYKHIEIFFNLLEKIKLNKENNFKILNLIIGVINNNNEKKEEQLYKKIVEDLDNYFFQNNIFFIEINGNYFGIPLYIVKNLKIDNDFDKYMMNKVSNYVIDENAILEGIINNKYLLLNELYNKKLFNYKYKEKTLSVLSTIIGNRDEYPYKKFKRIYENIKGFTEILPEKEKNDLKDFYNVKMSSYENELKSLENILLLLKKLYPSKEMINIQNITELKNKLEVNKITELDSFKEEINSFKNKYKEKIDKYLLYLNSYLFLELIYKEENQNENNEDEIIENVKNKIDHFIEIMFNPINNEEKVSQILEN